MTKTRTLRLAIAALLASAAARAGESTEVSVPACPPDLVPIVTVAPDYYERLHSSSGSVVVDFLVGADGAVSEPSIRESTPDGRLDRAVLRAVSKWKYPPERGRVCRATTRFVFQLDSPRPESE